MSKRFYYNYEFLSSTDTPSIIDLKEDKKYYLETDDDFVIIELLLNNIIHENEELNFRVEDLLYQIGYNGLNNKTCEDCECRIKDIGYCWMWDMEVDENDIVVACDKRKVKG